MADRKPSAEHVGAHFIEPMLCLAVPALPNGPQWEYELKLDGYRAIGLKAHGRTLLLSRNGRDFTRRFQPIARALEALPDETGDRWRSRCTRRDRTAIVQPATELCEQRVHVGFLCIRSADASGQECDARTVEGAVASFCVPK